MEIDKLKKALQEDGELYLRVKAHAGSSKTEIKGVLEDTDGKILKINIAAQPVKGRANQELIKFLAKELGAPKDNVKIISGAGDNFKFVKIIKKHDFKREKNT